MAAEEVARLYQYLDYERSATGLFEYAYFVMELSSLHAGWHAGEWLDSAPIFTQEQFDSFLQGAIINNVRQPDYYGPLVRLEGDGGEVKFLVHSPVGMDRIYYLHCVVLTDGRVESHSGDVLVELGPGRVY